MDGEKLRDGIFALRTRRIGSVAECMIRRLLKYSKGRSRFHDLYDDLLNRRIEVKFSVVQKRSRRRVTEDTVLRCLEEAVEENRPNNRMVAFPEWTKHNFDCNIQQVKRVEFDVLYYGLFFADCVKIFRIESQEIKENSKGGRIYYSDRQHKRNIGEGQFHINPQTFQIHLDHYHYKTLSYDELYKLLAGK